MLKSLSSPRGMVTAPHHLAAQGGLAVLREGGNAVEAMVAAAATIAVVYPHMNAHRRRRLLADRATRRRRRWAHRGLRPGRQPSDRRRSTGSRASTRFRRADPLPANTVAGAISGWRAALDTRGRHLARCTRLLDDAIAYARHGVPVTQSQVDLHDALRGRARATARLRQGTYLRDGKPPRAGTLQRFPALAETLERLAQARARRFLPRRSRRGDRGGARRGSAAPSGHADLRAHTGHGREAALRRTLRRRRSTTCRRPRRGSPRS